MHKNAFILADIMSLWMLLPLLVARLIMADVTFVTLLCNKHLFIGKSRRKLLFVSNGPSATGSTRGVTEEEEEWNGAKKEVGCGNL